MSHSPSEPAPNHPLARFYMVEAQLRACGIRDVRLLAQFRRLARENFLPPLMTGAAYVDADIHISTGRYLMEPLVMARLMEAAEVAPTDRVLDLAPATGFSTIVLAGLARQVVAIEPDEMIHLLLRSALKTHGVENVELKPATTDPFKNTGSDYDVIFVNGSLEAAPSELTNALAENGRLVVVIRHPEWGVGSAKLFRKCRGEIIEQNLFEANAKPFPVTQPKPAFVF